ncbi:MAG: diacylglycerol kinase family lipid kinase, partial [Rikenellaceae bacterium]|nr:diacylglycerol kinase family lipid kinase [Rikenellaceae bacterium]
KLLRDHHIGFDFVFSEKKFHAIELAVEAINNGYRKIVVVGGDGTIHEVVNGIMIQKEVPSAEVLLAVIAVGTGNDWIRMFGIPRKYTDAIRAMVDGHSFLQDIARVSFYKSNFPQQRYMANVAGLGFDASVNKYYNRLKDTGKHGSWIYQWGMFKVILSYKTPRMTVTIDGETFAEQPFFSSTIGIGKYNGGGMMQMPEAIADDGLLDVTLIRKMSKLRVLANFRSLYNGKIYRIPKVSHHRGRKIAVTSHPESAIEVDGEALGYSPFEFEVIDRAIRVIVSEKFLQEDLKNKVEQLKNN